MRGEAEVRGWVSRGVCTDCKKRRFVRRYVEVILAPNEWLLCLRCARRRANR